MIYYATLIISKEPIKLPEDLSADPNVQHLVSQEFKIGTDINFFPGHNHSCKIEKSAPEYCNEVAQLFRGGGSSISVAILDWLKHLCRSTAYKPLYFKHEAEK
ncbi:MAG: hypothetical protein ACD_7C00262G0001 [uncultured bacterium]|nr:MAG: hypothetical protein ACD_7C00262G0001 [uncultured bacterium]